MPKIVDHEERRSRIARAAMHQIAESGVEDLRLTDVAARAGWTTGVLTHYFKNKQELLNEALKVTFDEVVAEALIDVDDTDLTLRDMLRKWLPCSPGRVTGWKAWIAFVGNGQFSETDREIHEEYYNLLSARGKMRLAREDLCIDPQDASDLLLAFFDGLCTRVVMEPDKWPRDRQEALLDTYMDCVLGKTI